MKNEINRAFTAKKILFVIDTYQTNNNGTSISAQRYPAQLRERGHEVRILCADEQPAADKFQAVGLFSPVVYKEQMPKTNIPPFYIYMGKDDMFINNGRRFHKRLTKSGIDHFYIENEGGHTWRNWRLYLSDFLTKL